MGLSLSTSRIIIMAIIAFFSLLLIFLIILHCYTSRRAHLEEFKASQAVIGRWHQYMRASVRGLPAPEMSWSRKEIRYSSGLPRTPSAVAALEHEKKSGKEYGRGSRSDSGRKSRGSEGGIRKSTASSDSETVGLVAGKSRSSV